MKVPRRVNYALLAFLAVLNLALRYPRTPHETGVDSFFIHTLATQVAVHGYAEWILNPLSYFGLYPLSYPSASPFLIAGLTITSGLPMEAAILVLSPLLGLIGMLSAYLMGREMNDDDRFSFAVAFLYSLAPRFLTFTVWTASSRNLFMALAPIFVWAILRTYHRKDSKHAALLVLFLAMLMATHRLTILLAVAIVAFLVSYAVLILVRLLKLRFPRLFLAPSVRARLPYVTLAAFAGIAAFMLLGTNVLDEYAQGELTAGDDYPSKLVNLGASVSRSVGLAFPLALAGVVVVARERGKASVRTFLLLALLLLIPTLFLRTYAGFYILPFLALAGGFGLLGIVRLGRRRPRITRALTALLFAAVLLGTVAVEGYEAARTTYPDSATYDLALYLQTHGRGTIVSNDGLLGIRMAAYSSLPYLPVGGAGTNFQSPELLAFGFYSREEVESQISRISLLDLTIESDSPFVAGGIQAELDWVHILQTPAGDLSEGLLQRYHPAYFLENEAYPNAFTAYGNTYCSDFAFSVREGSYRVYDGGVYSVWYVYPPGAEVASGPSGRKCP